MMSSATMTKGHGPVKDPQSLSLDNGKRVTIKKKSVVKKVVKGESSEIEPKTSAKNNESVKSQQYTTAKRVSENGAKSPKREGNKAIIRATCKKKELSDGRNQVLQKGSGRSLSKGSNRSLSNGSNNSLSSLSKVQTTPDMKPNTDIQKTALKNENSLKKTKVQAKANTGVNPVKRASTENIVRSPKPAPKAQIQSRSPKPAPKAQIQSRSPKPAPKAQIQNRVSIGSKNEKASMKPTDTGAKNKIGKEAESDSSSGKPKQTKPPVRKTPARSQSLGAAPRPSTCAAPKPRKPLSNNAIGNTTDPKCPDKKPEPRQPATSRQQPITNEKKSASTGTELKSRKIVRKHPGIGDQALSDDAPTRKVIRRKSFGGETTTPDQTLSEDAPSRKIVRRKSFGGETTTPKCPSKKISDSTPRDKISRPSGQQPSLSTTSTSTEPKSRQLASTQSGGGPKVTPNAPARKVAAPKSPKAPPRKVAAPKLPKAPPRKVAASADAPPRKVIRSKSSTTGGPVKKVLDARPLGKMQAAVAKQTAPASGKSNITPSVQRLALLGKNSVVDKKKTAANPTTTATTSSIERPNTVLRTKSAPTKKAAPMQPEYKQDDFHKTKEQKQERISDGAIPRLNIPPMRVSKVKRESMKRESIYALFLSDTTVAIELADFDDSSFSECEFIASENPLVERVAFNADEMKVGHEMF